MRPTVTLKENIISVCVPRDSTTSKRGFAVVVAAVYLKIALVMSQLEFGAFMRETQLKNLTPSRDPFRRARYVFQCSMDALITEVMLAFHGTETELLEG